MIRPLHIMFSGRARPYGAIAFAKIFLFCLFVFSGYSSQVMAQNVTITNYNEDDTDTDNENSVIETSSPVINILQKYTWLVTVTGKNGEIRQFATRRPDTMVLNNVERVQLRSVFIADHKFTGHTCALEYSINGSASIAANGINVLNTGIFQKEPDERLCGLEEKGFVHLDLRDSTDSLSILYVPKPRIQILSMRLKMMDLSKAEKDHDDIRISNSHDLSVGYYFLAFGIVFMLFFVFAREKTENLYFALFCLCAALYCIFKTSTLYLYNILSLFFFVYSFEFISFFFAKVLRNKNRSRISLFIRLAITAACFHPAILYNFTFFGKPINNNLIIGSSTFMSVPIILLIIFFILFCISSFSSVANLVRGFRQKRWEARTIVIICSVAVFVSTMMPHKGSEVLTWISNIGVYLYPLSAAIVLSRTNGLNQKKMIGQLLSIEKLSEENLAKEKETKQILENQNTELERKVNERTQEVIHQKEIIEIKNKSITDNLTYAQRIQSAILPDINLIYKTLAQSFILYLPKDIVSGDFYFFSERSNRVLIIAGDCTGHGVSGAFMSMIGGSLLNQIINERGIEQPDQILNQLNGSVIAALKQNENESNDGMDVSICSFDLASNELQFAGANRPLWLFREHGLQVLRPDKHPIGGLQSAVDRKFTNHTLKLQPNDTVYIFTDGFADQFGGERGKKMMTSKFKEVLLAIQQMSMRQQEQYLKNYFDRWKGNNEQVDDVLVIGIRV